MRINVALALLLALPPSSALAQAGSARRDGVFETADNTAPASYDQKVAVTMSSVSAGPSYVIGVSDVLHISVWKEPDLTATLPVRPDGMVSVPLLNDILAEGLTPMQLSAIIQQRLKKYVAVPRVTVLVTQANAQRVYLLGEVLRTGPIPLTPNMTVLQALATAGFTQFANTKKIYVLRTGDGQEEKIPFNYKQVLKGEAMSQNILLKPGDTIVVP
jgi:polysaccharide biosynthesis/export protein